MDKLHDEIRRTLEKIGSREKYINSQLEHLVQEFRAAQDQLAQVNKTDFRSFNDIWRGVVIIYFHNAISISNQLLDSWGKEGRSSFRISGKYSLRSLLPSSTKCIANSIYIVVGTCIGEPHDINLLIFCDQL